MPILIVLALLAGGGVAIGADKSLPGDMLYPVKVGINEEFRGWLSVSEEAKANWEVTRAQRRLEEAERLAAEGSLNTEVRATIESNFEAHSSKVRDRIAKFENKEDFNSAVNVSSNFEMSLNAHEKILAKLFQEETDSSVKVEIKPIGKKVNTAARAAKELRLKNETKVSSEVRVGAQASAEGKLRAAEKKLEETKKFAESVKFDAEMKLQADAKIEAAQTTIDYGKTRLEAGAYGDAFSAFQKAIRISQEAKLLIAARENLNVDVQIDDAMGGDSESDDFSGDDDDNDDIRIEGKLKVNLGL